MFGTNHLYDFQLDFPEEVGDYYMWGATDLEQNEETIVPSILRIFEYKVRNIQEQGHYMQLLNREVSLGEHLKMVSFSSVYTPNGPAMLHENYVKSFNKLKNSEGNIPGMDQSVSEILKTRRFSKIPKFEKPVIN